MRPEINQLKTLEGKPFTLLNLPYFLAGQLKVYVRRLVEGQKVKN